MIIEIELNGYVAFVIIMNLLGLVLGRPLAISFWEWRAGKWLDKQKEEERKQKEAQHE